MHRLWYDADKASENNLLSIVITNPGLVILEDCNTILRRDYAHMTDKVKLISGGVSGNEPAHTGFVGPGMLTGAICGEISCAPPVYSILRVLEEVGADYNPGILLIIQNYPGNRINFGLAKLRAENMGIYVKMVIVGEEVNLECSNKTIEKRGLAGILFIHKIAGAMAEEGKNLEYIYDECNKIIKSRDLATTSINIKLLLSHDQNVFSKGNSCTKTETGYRIHDESAIYQVNLTSLEDVANFVVRRLTVIAPDSEQLSARIFPDNNNIAVMVNSLGGNNQIECNILIFEIVKQFALMNLVVQRIYTGHLITSLDTCGFEISLINLSTDPKRIEYLDFPTLAVAWPKALTLPMVGIEETLQWSPTVSTKYCKEYCNDILPRVEPRGLTMCCRSGQVLLTIISFACEALIACTKQLNIMGKDCGIGECGTTLGRGADAIKTAIKENKINCIYPFVTFTQISCIIEKVIGGLQGGLYSIFFHAVAKVFAENNGPITSRTWLNALTQGNNMIIEIGKLSVGGRTMLDPLTTAQHVLTGALDGEMHPIQAFGEAVKAAEYCAMQTMNARVFCGPDDLIKAKTYKYPDPGAHAVGIWMRAVYEGVKLKLACECDL